MSKFVLVTTAHRGVFAGEMVARGGDAITLKDVRMCVYWSEAMKGVLGLASLGPDADCRVSPAVSEGTIEAVTAVFDVTDEAKARWEAAPWG